MSRTCLLLPSLATLRIDADASSSRANSKRKAAGVSSSSHWGLSSDSSTRLGLISLSRIMRARDDSVLAAAAISPAGASLLRALRDLLQRIAVTVGGASPQLGDVQVATFFSMAGSAIANRRQYEGGLTLPSVLPFERARLLVRVLLDALNTARLNDNGARVAALLLLQPPSPLDAVGQAAVSTLASEVEAAMTARLGGGSSGAVSSSSSSRSTPPPVPALPIPSLQIPALQVPAPLPFVIDAAQTLAANVVRLVAVRLARPLLQSEIATIDSSLDEGLSVLQAGGAATRQQLLNSNVLIALANPGAAQVWSCWLEAVDSGVMSVDALATAAEGGVQSVAAVLFVAGVVI